MGISSVIAIVNIFCLLTMTFVLINNLKTTDELLDEYEKCLNKNLSYAVQRKTLMEIIINAKINKENYFKTLEKIERELFK